MVNAVGVISWNAQDVEIAAEYYTITGSNPVLTTKGILVKEQPERSRWFDSINAYVGYRGSLVPDLFDSGICILKLFLNFFNKRLGREVKNAYL